MKFTKHYIISFTAVIGLLSGAALIILTSDSDRAQSKRAETTQATDKKNGLPFDAQPTAETSFAATIKGKIEGQPIKATIEYDGDGRSRFISKHDEQSQQIIITPDASYSCSGDDCTHFPNSETASPLFNPADYVYTVDDINSLNTNAQYIGKESCPAGTCNVWKVQNENEELSNIYVDAADKLISQVTGSSPNGEFTIVYDYRKITITTPENT